MTVKPSPASTAFTLPVRHVIDVFPILGLGRGLGLSLGLGRGRGRGIGFRLRFARTLALALTLAYVLSYMSWSYVLVSCLFWAWSYVSSSDQ